MRRAATWVAGLGLAVLLIGLAIVPLTAPAFTRIVGSRTSLVQESGLSHARMRQVAEQVREFVVDSDKTALPTTVDGRPGFDTAAVAHLVDVRHVLSMAKAFTGLLAVVLLLALGIEVAQKRTSRIADAMCAGALIATVFVLLAIAAAATNFDTFFTAFHGLFFRAGTWTFPSDSLLIQTFPERFWAIAGVTWALLVLAGAALLAAIACVLKASRAHRLA